VFIEIKSKLGVLLVSLHEEKMVLNNKTSSLYKIVAIV